MKLRLLEFIRCPACHGRLRLRDAETEWLHNEVASGPLECRSCSARYPVQDGIPRLLAAGDVPAGAETRRTSEAFGYLWSQPFAATDEPRPYHFEKMRTALDFDAPRGLVMDAGCGDGIDLANHARRAGVEVVGVERSDGGCRTSAARITAAANAHVVQADLRRLPFSDGTFDSVYSYGVLHHVASPPAAAQEIARVTRAGGTVAIYLYEDFGERGPAWRLALAAVNSSRILTTRLPPKLLFTLCRIASPFVYLFCTVPHLLLRSLPGFRRLVARLPFRHGQGPFRLAGDLYDRFSAPIEERYSRDAAANLLRRTGLEVNAVAYERGWMVGARRPAERAASEQGAGHV